MLNEAESRSPFFIRSTPHSMPSPPIRVLILCGLCLGMLAAQKTPPLSAGQKKNLASNIRRHFGDAPRRPGPKAKLSGALRPAAVLRTEALVAHWELERAQPYFGRDWTWGVLYTGFMAASRVLPHAGYHRAMAAMARHFHWRLRSRVPVADDQTLGQTYLELYLQHPAAYKIAATRAAMDRLLTGATARIPKAQAPIAWWWCDALFMAPAAWTRMYAATHQHKYLRYMDQHWRQTSRRLYDLNRHLYFRDITYLNKTGPRGGPIFWSRGNGWVLAGLARTLAYLPHHDPARGFYRRQMRQMAAALAQLQGRRSGLWHSNLLDARDYPQPETSGSALITFALAWGVRHGVLKRARYLPVIARAWRGLTRQIYASGRLGNIQPTGAGPAHYPASACFNYGVGAFLLAGAQVSRLKQ